MLQAVARISKAIIFCSVQDSTCGLNCNQRNCSEFFKTQLVYD